MKIRVITFILFFLLSFALEAGADIIYLKNGRSMQGKIKKQNEDGVWLDIGAGAVKFTWGQIEKIDAPGFDFKAKGKQKETVKPKVAAEKPRDVLAKTKAFSVIYPSDWKKETNEENLLLKGPVLVGGKGPFIVLREEAGEAAARSMQTTKENYHRWKDLPDVKNKMLEFLMSLFKKTYGTDKFKFVSLDYEEKGDFIIHDMVTIDKAHDMKIRDTSVITKAEPTRGYNLIYMCPKEDYDDYLPVFEKCLDSFSLNE